MDEQVKVVLIGDPGVGKSSILEHYLESDFNPHIESTVGVSFKTKEISFPEKTVKLNLWDTAGQEKYHSLTKMYCRGAKAAILVYDITNRDSFNNLKNWHQMVSELSNENTIFAVVGNKEDLIDREAVGLDEARAFATKINATYKKTSAKNGVGIEELFRAITCKVFPELETSRAQSTIILDKSPVYKTNKKSCCS